MLVGVGLQAGGHWRCSHSPPLRSFAKPSCCGAARDFQLAAQKLSVPCPPARHTAVELHGDVRIDEFAWLKDPSRRSREVMQYLKQEDDYARQQLTPVAALAKELEDELAALEWQAAIQAFAAGADGTDAQTEQASMLAGTAASPGNDAMQHVVVDGYRIWLSSEPSSVMGCRMHMLHVQCSAGCGTDTASSSNTLQPAGGSSANSSAAAVSLNFMLLDEASRSSAVCQGSRSAYHVHTVQLSPNGLLAAFTEACYSRDLGLQPNCYNLCVLQLQPAVQDALKVHALGDVQDGMQSMHGLELNSLVPRVLTTGVSGPLHWSADGKIIYFTRVVEGNSSALYAISFQHVTPSNMEPTLPTPRASLLQHDQEASAETDLKEHLILTDAGQTQLEFVEQPDGLVTLQSQTFSGRPCQIRTLLSSIRPMGHPHQPLISSKTHVEEEEGQMAFASSAWSTLLPRQHGSTYRLLYAGKPHQYIVHRITLDIPNGELLYLSSHMYFAGLRNKTADGDSSQSQLPVLLNHSTHARLHDVQAVGAGQLLVTQQMLQENGLPRGAYQILLLQLQATTASLSQRGQGPNLPNDKDVPLAEGLLPSSNAAVRLQQVASAKFKIQPFAHDLSCVTLLHCPAESSPRSGTGQQMQQHPGASQLPSSHSPVVESTHRQSSMRVRIEFSSLAGPPQSAELQLLLLSAGQGSSLMHAEAAVNTLPTLTAPDKLTGSKTSMAAGRGATADGNDGADDGQGEHVESLSAALGPYAVDVLWASSPDGVQVPMTLAYNREKVALGKQPLPTALAVYGAYGQPDSWAYRAGVQLLMDRGVVYAIAHVRGGGTLGCRWHAAGRGQDKAVGVQDLLACTLHLAAVGVTDAGRLCLESTSAGGWVAGAALVAAPHLFPCTVLTVPALDALGAAIDEQYAWDELGDPVTDADVYRSMKRWSPYDAFLAPAANTVGNASKRALQTPPGYQPQCEDTSLHAQAGFGQRADTHAAGNTRILCEQSSSQGGSLAAGAAWPPHNQLLLRVGLYDTVVNFWDPLKWLARLRRLASDRQQVDAGGKCCQCLVDAVGTYESTADGSGGSSHAGSCIGNDEGSGCAGVCMVVRPGHHDAWGDVSGEASKRAFQLLHLAHGKGLY